MHRTEDQYAAPGGLFTDGPPGTRVTKDWLNAVQEEIAAVITGAGYSLKDKQTDTYTQLYNSIKSMTGLGMTAREKWVRSHGGQWCEFAYYDPDEIMVKCKNTQGLGIFAGFVLNDDSYLELQSDQKVKLDVPGSAGQIIDGITARLNSEWYIVWAYKTSAGSLGFAFTWMPYTNITVDNPTNTLTLAQVNAQDIGFLFPVNSKIALFQDTDEWETPLAWQNAGGVTYDSSKDKPKIISRTSTVLTLGANLENNDFTQPATKVYQVEGFMPLQVSDGAISSTIGIRGYRDTGFRVKTTAAGAIQNFVTSGNIVTHIRIAATGDVATSTTTTVYLLTMIPPDAREARVTAYGINALNVPQNFISMYWETSGDIVGEAIMYIAGNFMGSVPIFHKLVRTWSNLSTSSYFGIVGWVMPT